MESRCEGVPLRGVPFPVPVAGIVRGRDAADEAYMDVLAAVPATGTGNGTPLDRVCAKQGQSRRMSHPRLSIST
jgi:hypothetical protein